MSIKYIQGQVAPLLVAYLLVGISAGSAARIIPHQGEHRQQISNQFTYLGSYTSPQTQNGGGVSTQNAGTRATSFYFISQNAAGHATAENDCKAFLGENATLLYIETQDELLNVTDFLKTDNTISSAWMGGTYDVNKAALSWGNGVIIGPWAPWDDGHPSTQLPVTRVLLSNKGLIKFRTAFNTESLRYLCELRTGLVEEEADPCYSDNDLVIVVDSSGSISEDQYAVALEFTVRLALAWADNPQNRMSVVVYSNAAQTIINLGQQLSVTALRDAIYNAPYIGGGTASDLGLAQALGEFQQHTRSAPKNMVFLTDGVSNDPQATAAAAKSISNAGIRSFAVGIGSGIRAEELLTIAGENPDHVFNTDGFADLLKLLQPVSRRVCP